MSRRMRASAVPSVTVLIAVVVLGGCGRSSEPSSESRPSSTPAVCAAPPAASPTTNSPDSPSGSPNAPKLTALEIAQRLPPMPSTVRGGWLGDSWFDFEGTRDPHVLSSTGRSWSVRSSEAFGMEYLYGGSIHVRVYDSPAARLAVEHSMPQGVYFESYQPRAGSPDTLMEDRFRCFASCGAVSVEVWAEETGTDFVTWTNDAIVQSQTGLEQIFGGCPAWDDAGVPGSELSS
jgi:hypothetical protein